jgi:hypothetical protein
LYCHKLAAPPLHPARRQLLAPLLLPLLLLLLLRAAFCCY